MDTNKNLYTVVYATVLVVLVAAVLAFVSSSLKEKQQKNIDVEKQQSILASVELASEAGEVSDKISYVQGEFRKYVTDSYIVNGLGEKTEGDAFRVDLKGVYEAMKQIDAASSDKAEELKSALRLPVFECTMDNGEKVFILSCYGAGLWGPIWGYVGIKDDFDTIYGANFSHKSETPGLGAEIANHAFSNQFKNKTIFDGSLFTSIQIVKGGADSSNPHQVDAISGGTITSKSLEASIRQWFSHYLPFLSKSKEAAAVAQSEELAQKDEAAQEGANGGTDNTDNK